MSSGAFTQLHPDAVGEIIKTEFSGKKPRKLIFPSLITSIDDRVLLLASDNKPGLSLPFREHKLTKNNSKYIGRDTSNVLPFVEELLAFMFLNPDGAIDKGSGASYLGLMKGTPEKLVIPTSIDLDEAHTGDNIQPSGDWIRVAPHRRHLWLTLDDAELLTKPHATELGDGAKYIIAHYIHSETEVMEPTHALVHQD